MQHFAVFIPETGEIVRSGVCLQASVSAQARDGESVRECEPTINHKSHYVVGDSFVEFPQKPSEFHEWNWQSLEWVENDGLVATAYIHKRKVAYPPIGDQLDALWKGGDALTQMQGQILAVKAAYPKPQEGIE